jgi:hypothetical protein
MEVNAGLVRMGIFFGMFAVMLFCERRGPFVVSVLSQRLRGANSAAMANGRAAARKPTARKTSTYA